MKTCDCFLWATDHDFKHCLTTKWRVEVIAGNSGTWASNGLRFDTPEKAEEYAKDLFMRWRWLLVRKWRVVEVL